MTQRLLFRVLLAASLTTCVADHIQAQQTEVLVGMEAAAYQTGNPYGGTPSLGAMLGLERPVSSRLSVRTSATVMRVLRIGDDISLCLLAPDGSCYPDPVFPLWLSRIEVLGAFSPVRNGPVRLIAGGGISVAGDAREAERNSRALPLKTRMQAVWRGGLDLRFGSSKRPTRIQFTRSGFSSDPFSLTFVDAITIVLRP